MQENLLVALGLLAVFGLVFILPKVIEDNIFAGIMTLLLSPFLRKRNRNDDKKD